MKLKNKLTLGLLFLFALILFFGGLAIFYINRLSSDEEKILKNNQETLLYSNNMLNALEDIPNKFVTITVFEQNLEKQEHNITEPGEGDATQTVRNHFDILKKNAADSAQYPVIRRALFKINELNEQAIIRKKWSCPKHG